MKTKILIALSCIGIFASMHLREVAYAEGADQSGQPENKQNASAGDEIVASIGNAVIRRSEINKAVNQYMNMAKARKVEVPDRDRLFLMVLDAKIRSEVIKIAAKQAGIDRDKNYHTRLKDLQDQLLMELYLEKEVSAKITEAALRSAYKKLSEQISKEKEYRIRHIFVREENTAKEVISKLDKGGDFAALADQYNSMSREKGGDLGYVLGSSVPEPVRKVVTELKPGEYTKSAAKVQAGYLVFKLEDVRDAKVPTMEEAQPRLVELVKQESMQALVKRLIVQSKVKVFAKEAAAFQGQQQ
ncbi:MAG: peptidyl-prolyl cis-trans isomerase [Holosporales bacterium]|jgi:peptidyl-prolyl cis-trans isomerase C|nr:peptidyl-prolyl cis-trans isomerase [Holosporales bacterium]